MHALLLRLVQYGVTPIFLILAGVNFVLEQNGGGHMAHMAMSKPEDVAVMGQAPETTMGLVDMLAMSGLGSMWLMYLLMGLAHLSPWLTRAKSH